MGYLTRKTKIFIGFFLITLVIALIAVMIVGNSGEIFFAEKPWAYSTPEEQGFDSVVLVNLLQRIKAENLDIHSIILMRNNHIFFEFYAYPYKADTLQHAMSVGKSMVSALVGIVHGEGAISSLDTPLIDSFPEYRSSIKDAHKLNITLRHALNMTTGLKATDDNSVALSAIGGSDSWIKATWEQKMGHTPGDAFGYGSFITHLIAQVTQRAVKEELVGYAKKKLFEPIGIKEIQAERDPEGNWFGGGGLWMTSRDLLRFGLLFLREGNWFGKQVVPKNWVKESTTNQIGDLTAHTGGVMYDGYGYQWWTFDSAYSAVGVGGQQIFIVPVLNFVAVITRANPKLDIVNEYFMQALKSPYWAAEANPKALEELNNLVTELGKPRQQPKTVSLLAATASTFSIKTEILDKRYEVMADEKQHLVYRSFLLGWDEASNQYYWEVERGEGEKSKFNLGTKGASAFTDIVSGGKRPDGKNHYAATMAWLDNGILLIDIHEIGYPIKQLWTVAFSGNNAKVLITIRGAKSGKMSFNAKY